MDFSLTDEQLEYRAAAVNFARKELAEGVVERDRQGAFSRELWLKCAEFGVQGLPFPREYGGQGADLMTTVLVMEGLGYGCKDNGLLFALGAQM
jgi:alkylation response protein AidB-like acyl-CoA dehydrogenase